MTWADVFLFYTLWNMDDMALKAFNHKDYPNLVSYYKKMRKLDNWDEYVHRHLPTNMK